MSATLPTLERIANLEREVARLHRILQEANARLAPGDPVNVEMRSRAYLFREIREVLK